jgi:hypothetical protein
MVRATGWETLSDAAKHQKSRKRVQGFCVSLYLSHSFQGSQLDSCVEVIVNHNTSYIALCKTMQVTLKRLIPTRH